MSKAVGENGKGLKANSNKILMSLLPGPALYEVGRVLTYGANKYTVCQDCKATFQNGRTTCSECGSANITTGSHNWSKGMNWSWIVDALERHLEKFKRGIDIDHESGLLHISQVACNALFLTTFQVMNIGTDDRWKPSKESLKYMEELRNWLDETMLQVREGVPVKLSLDDEFNDKENIEVNIDEQTKAYLYELAKKDGKTVNEIATECVQRFVDEKDEW